MSITLHQQFIEIDLPDGVHGRFDYLWLRDNCPSAFHPQTKERVFDLLSVPQDLRPDKAEIIGNTLHISWANDGHLSEYPLPWLIQFTRHPRPEPPANIINWDHSIASNLPKVSYADIVDHPHGLPRWLSLLQEFGFALVTHAPPNHGEVLRLTAIIGPPRTTNFGTLFDVVSKPHPNNNAYTALHLSPHMDLPNWEHPPDYQFLHCLENDAQGGDSLLVDGFKVATQLRQEDPDAFALLTRSPMNFRFHDDDHDIRTRAPAITLDHQGEIQEIRFNRAIMDTLIGDPEELGALYRAHRHFTALSREPNLQLTLRLKPGEILGFNNLRVLHGRKTFDPNTGRRHLQGCYIDRDYLRSKLRLLESREF